MQWIAPFDSEKYGATKYEKNILNLHTTLLSLLMTMEEGQSNHVVPKILHPSYFKNLR